MIVRLFCPKCAYEAAQRRLPQTAIDVPVPMAKLSDDGRYSVHCDAGHVTTVTLDNVKFELLFEPGVNELVDGYPRAAVESFASALERFQEFFVRVVMVHFSVPATEVDAAWKSVSKQSERQLGAYIASSLMLTKSRPPLLNPNTEVRFRNQVIHDGYVPTHDEAVAFGDAVMALINPALDVLRTTAGEALLATYRATSPRATAPVTDANDLANFTGVVNFITTIDVRNQPKEDERRCGVASQFARIRRGRQPHRMYLLTTEEMRKLHPERFTPS
jgi:hypothetical protein